MTEIVFNIKDLREEPPFYAKIHLNPQKLNLLGKLYPNFHESPLKMKEMEKKKLFFLIAFLWSQPWWSDLTFWNFPIFLTRHNKFFVTFCKQKQGKVTQQSFNYQIDAFTRFFFISVTFHIITLRNCFRMWVKIVCWCENERFLRGKCDECWMTN